MKEKDNLQKLEIIETRMRPANFYDASIKKYLTGITFYTCFKVGEQIYEIGQYFTRREVLEALKEGESDER